MMQFPLHPCLGGLPTYYIRHAHEYIIQRYTPILTSLVHAAFNLKTPSNNIKPHEQQWRRILHIKDQKYTIVETYEKNYINAPHDINTILKSFKDPTILGPTTPGNPSGHIFLLRGIHQTLPNDITKMDDYYDILIAEIRSCTHHNPRTHFHENPIPNLFAIIQSLANIPNIEQYCKCGPNVPLEPLKQEETHTSYQELYDAIDQYIILDGNIPGTHMQQCLNDMYRTNIATRGPNMIKLITQIYERLQQHNHNKNHPFTCNDDDNSVYYEHTKNTLDIQDYHDQFLVHATDNSISIAHQNKGQVYRIYTLPNGDWSVIEHPSYQRSKTIENLHLTLQSIDCCTEEDMK